MFGVVWDYYSSKLKGKQYKQNTSPKSYKTEIKIVANARNHFGTVGKLQFKFKFLLKDVKIVAAEISLTNSVPVCIKFSRVLTLLKTRPSSDVWNCENAKT